MTQIPLLHGISGSNSADSEVALPINLEPVPVDNGLSKGYLRTAAGAVPFATGPGPDRGGIVWNNQHIRVMGTSLVRIAANGAVTTLATIPGTGQVRLDYGFGRLAIAADKKLFYWDGTALTQVTDSDLGPVLDMMWIGGYYATTDGTSIVVTDLSNPTSVNPLKYGSAEADPDMVVGLMKLRGELYALGSNTIESFQNIGGSLFPFQANQGATIQRGCCGPFAKCYYLQTIAFVGSGRNEALGVHLVGSGIADKISTRDIDDELANVTDPTKIICESRVSRDENRLLIHLPDKTLIYLASASKQAGEAVWYIAQSGLGLDQEYRLRNAVMVNGDLVVGDTRSSSLGKVSETVSTHFGDVAGWQFQTMMLDNASNSFIAHSLELVGLPGRASGDPVVMFSSSIDGQTWSPERANRIGKAGNRSKRCVWNPHRRFRNYATLKFRGVSPGPVSWAELQADLEPLAV